MLLGFATLTTIAVSLAVGAFDNSTNLYVSLLNYGVLGLITIGFFTGKIVSSKQYELALDDKTREHDELLALRQRTEEQILPAVIRSTDLMARYLNREPMR